MAEPPVRGTHEEARYSLLVRRPPFHAALLIVATASVTVLALPRAASAESALSLPLPPRFGEVSAQTFDEAGHRLGGARLRVEQLPNGDVSLLSESRIDGGAMNRLTAELAPVDHGEHLRPLTEESHTELPGGHDLGFLRIDHVARTIRCVPPIGETVELEMPDGDRVALTPMNLLFLPLVRREATEVDFEIAVCRGGPRTVGAKARLAPIAAGDDTLGRLVEVRFALDFGPLLSAVVKPFLPRFSLWFDRATAGDWMASRMPLYSTGPTVVIVRAGLTPEALGLDR